jgi:precorrin-4/cobalt-precorrin-4 C11-methyltransferase
MIEAVARVLTAAYGAGATCAVVYRASHPDQKVIVTRMADLVAQVKAAGITRQALIIVGKVMDVGRAHIPHKSKLYDKDFKHGFRGSREIEK